MRCAWSRRHSECYQGQVRICRQRRPRSCLRHRQRERRIPIESARQRRSMAEPIASRASSYSQRRVQTLANPRLRVSALVGSHPFEDVGSKVVFRMRNSVLKHPKMLRPNGKADTIADVRKLIFILQFF